MQHLTDHRVDPLPRRASSRARAAARVVHLSVAGMGCRNCAYRVQNALLTTAGVVDAVVEEPSALATVWIRPSQVSVQDLILVVARAAEGTHHRFLAVQVGENVPPGRSP